MYALEGSDAQLVQLVFNRLNLVENQCSLLKGALSGHFQQSVSVSTTEVDTEPHPAVRIRLRNHSHEITAVVTNDPAVV